MRGTSRVRRNQGSRSSGAQTTDERRRLLSSFRSRNAILSLNRFREKVAVSQKINQTENAEAELMSVSRRKTVERAERDHDALKLSFLKAFMVLENVVMVTTY